MGSLVKRLERLEGRTFGSGEDPEARRKSTEELRASIRAKLERVIDEERRRGVPELSDEERTANLQAFRRELRRKAGWE